MKQKVLLGVLSILLVGLGTIGIHYSLTVSEKGSGHVLQHINSCRI